MHYLFGKFITSPFEGHIVDVFVDSHGNWHLLLLCNEDHSLHQVRMTHADVRLKPIVDPKEEN